MNLVSLITFLSAIIYILLGIYGLRLRPRTRLNWIFVCLCLACAIWAFCIAFMFPAANQHTAWIWFRLSAPGWCLGPALVLHFSLVLTEKREAHRPLLPIVLLYIPALFFMIMGMTTGLTASTLIYEDFGWSPLNQGNTIWYWAFASYYLLCIAASITVVWRWGLRSTLAREKQQARLVASCTFMGTLLAFFNETLLPVMGYTHVPKVPVVLWLIWAFGLWFAITRYRLLILNPSLATNEIVRSIDDLMILLDSYGKIIELNHRVSDLLAFREAELLRAPVDMITVSPARMREILDHLKTNSEAYSQQETELKTRNGLSIPVFLTISPIRDNFGDVISYVLVARDLRPTIALQNEISERIRAEDALHQSMLQLKEWSLRQEEQNHKLEIQNAELEAMTQNLAESNQVLAEKNVQLENLFNNVGQGFLSFYDDLLILQEFSRECSKIFGQSPAGHSLSALLYPIDQEQREFMDEVFCRVLKEKDETKAWLYLSLLPEEISLNERIISIEYKKVADSRVDHARSMLVILTDITEKRALQKQLVDERNMFSMVVKSIVNQQDLVQCIDDFEYFVACGLPQLANQKDSLDTIVAEALRSIHTFKGNFSQFDVSQVVSALHGLETVILDDQRDYDSIEGFLNFLQEFDLSRYLEKDLDIIRDLTGQDFFNRKNTCTINEDSLQELEAEMARLLSPAQCQQLLPQVQRLRYKPFKELLKAYPTHVEQLAVKINKQVHSLSIEGDDLPVDVDQYRGFAQSLVHVFRNSLDHGIEDLEERIARGKSPIATIACSISIRANQMLISISDDGRGIDPEKIREKVLGRGLMTRERALSCSDEELLAFIFADQFSTMEEATLISGRGVGLAAVRNEADRLNGSIQIINHPGQGVEFIFTLPLPRVESQLEPDLPAIMAGLENSATSFMFEQAGVLLKPVLSSVAASDNLLLGDSSVLLSIRGTIDAMVIIAVSETLADRLLTTFVLDELNDAEKYQLYPDLLAECANIIVGGSLKHWGKIQDLVSMESPVIVCNRGVVFRHGSSHSVLLRLESDAYRLTLALALLERPTGGEGI